MRRVATRLSVHGCAVTISVQQSSIIALGNGIATVFSFPFVGVAASDIVVSYTDADGNISILSPSDYTVSLNAAPAGQLWGIGGTITYPLAGSPIATGTSLTIQRTLPLTQTTSIADQGNFYPQAVEQALDTLCMEIQQVSARTGAFRGTWAPDVQYNYADLVIDGANGNDTGNLYFCAVANLSTTWAADLAAGDWVIALNVQIVPIPGEVGSVATIGALRSLSVSTLVVGQTIYVSGHTTVGDGGQGFFTYTETDPGDDDNGTIIHSDTSGSYYVRQINGPYNVKWFGATGDNSTDDTLALQNCIDASFVAYSQLLASVYIPIGQYVTSDTIFFDPPDNRQSSITYNTNLASITGYRMQVTCEVGDSLQAMITATKGDRPMTLEGPGSQVVENLTVKGAFASRPAGIFFSKRYSQRMLGFAMTSAGNERIHRNCAVFTAYAGWKTNYNGNDNLSSENYWDRCITGQTYVDVWFAGSQSYANTIVDCNFTGYLGICNESGVDVFWYGGSIGSNDGISSGNIVAKFDITAASAASVANAQLVSSADINYPMTYYLAAAGKYSPVVTMTLTGLTANDKELISNNFWVFCCANLPNFGPTVFFITSYNSTTNLLTLQLAPYYMYTNWNGASSGAGSTTLNTLLASDFNTVGSVIFANAGFPFFGPVVAWGAHIEVQDTPTMLHKGLATNRHDVLIEALTLQWNRALLSDPGNALQVASYIANQALPLFSESVPNKTLVTVRNIEFAFTDHNNKVAPFCIDLAGEGGSNDAIMIFEDCILPGMPTVYQTLCAPADTSNGGTSINQSTVRTKNCRIKATGFTDAYTNYLYYNNNPDMRGLLPDYSNAKLTIKQANIANMLSGGITNTADPTWGVGIYTVLEPTPSCCSVFFTATPGTDNTIAKNSFASWNQDITNTFTQAVGGVVFTTNHPEYFFPGLQIIDPSDSSAYIVIGINLYLAQVMVVRATGGSTRAIADGSGNTKHTSVVMVANQVAAMYSGSFTMSAVTSMTVSNTLVTAGSVILLSPTNASAATLMSGAHSLYVGSLSASTYFTVATADGNAAAGTETFRYMIKP